MISYTLTQTSQTCCVILLKSERILGELAVHGQFGVCFSSFKTYICRSYVLHSDPSPLTEVSIVTVSAGIKIINLFSHARLTRWIERHIQLYFMQTSVYTCMISTWVNRFKL